MRSLLVLVLRPCVRRPAWDCRRAPGETCSPVVQQRQATVLQQRLAGHGQSAAQQGEAVSGCGWYGLPASTACRPVAQGCPAASPRSSSSSCAGSPLTPEPRGLGPPEPISQDLSPGQCPSPGPHTDPAAPLRPPRAEPPGAHPPALLPPWTGAVPPGCNAALHGAAAGPPRPVEPAGPQPLCPGGHGCGLGKALLGGGGRPASSLWERSRLRALPLAMGVCVCLGTSFLPNPQHASSAHRPPAASAGATATPQRGSAGPSASCPEP